MIFLVLNGTTIDENIELIKRFKSSIRGVEFRADLLPSERHTDEGLKKLVDFCGQYYLQIIYTLRRVQDGGLFEGSDEEAMVLYGQASAFAFHYVDFDERLEPSILKQSFEKQKTIIIRSIHDFSQIPDGLEQRMRSYSAEGYLPKVAVKIGSTRELSQFMEMAQRLSDVNKILIGMGPVGFPTRVLTSLFGSLLTFASNNFNNKELGHISPDRLSELFNYYNIGKETALAGIIGNPVMHTRSPEIHNQAYHQLGLDAVYLPFETESPQAIFSFIDRVSSGEVGFRKGCFKGLSVTVPYKEKVIPLLDSCDDSVTKVGACNTVVFSMKSGELKSHGVNTDVDGFLIPLKKRLVTSGRIKSCQQNPLKVAVIGAGGAARAVIYALTLLNADISIFNRTESRARLLADEFHCNSFPLDKLKEFTGEFELIVQSTSAGMGALSELDPSEGYQYGGNEIAYEIVYAPERTQFIKRAEKSGCDIIGGLEMLRAQAEEQFELFTRGKKLPQV